MQGLCPGQLLTLRPAAVVPGGTYRWQDGLASPTRVVATPGRYRLQVLTYGGCTARDSVLVLSEPAPAAGLAPDSAVCRAAFPLLVRGRAQPPGTRLRWPDGSTGPEWRCPAPGTYALQLESPLGCRSTVTFRRRNADCPELLPTIITPNGDAVNQSFVLRGLNAAEWSIRLYNRWGRELYSQEKYDNRWSAQGQPDGLYYYLLTNPATGQRYKGWVEVVR